MKRSHIKTFLLIILLLHCKFSLSQVIFDNGILEFLNQPSNNYFSTVRNDTSFYVRHGIPFSGTDSLFFIEIYDIIVDNSDIIQDTFLFIITYEGGYKIKVEVFYKTGEIHKIIQFNKGILYGTSVSYYKSGKIKSIDRYVNGKLGGPWLWFHENGNIKTYANFTTENKEFNGVNKFNIVTYWYDNGTLCKEIKPINCNNENAFIETRWYRNGNIKTKGIFNNGKQYWVYYYENGQKQIEGYIIDAVWARIGKWNEWHENGQLKSEAFYKDGETQTEANIKTGIWSYWDEKGNLIKQEIYENDILVTTKEFLPVSKKEK